MNPVSRFALSLALIFPVFSLFNLFGQPQSFIPPLYADHILLLVFCGYCIYHSPFLNEKALFICIAFALTLNGVLEINNSISFIDLRAEYSLMLHLFSLILLLFISIFLLLHPSEKILFLFTKILWLILFTIQLLAFFKIIEGGTTGFVIYLLAGICSFISGIYTKENNLFHKRVFLLFSLLVFYDVFTYVSLLCV